MTVSLTDHERRIAEIDATLLTKGPTALDFSVLLFERKQHYEELYPESRQGGDHRSAAFKNKRKRISFCSDAAARLNLTERSIRLAVELAANLGDDVARLRGSKIEDNAAALRMVASLDRPRRASLLAIWKRKPELSFGALLIEARLKAERDSEEAAYERLCDAWGAAPAKVRRRFLATLGIDSQQADAIVNPRRRGAA